MAKGPMTRAAYFLYAETRKKRVYLNGDEANQFLNLVLKVYRNRYEVKDDNFPPFGSRLKNIISEILNLYSQLAS